MDGGNVDQVAVLRQTQQTLGSINKSLDAFTAAMKAQTALLATVLPGVQATAATATAGTATLPANPAGFIAATLPSGAAVRIPYYNP